MFDSIFQSTQTASYQVGDILLCTAASIAAGLIIALIFHILGDTSRNFKVTMLVLPLLVQSVIMMVNGNLGTSVAVLGTFGLVRFRSAQGSSKEICGVFFAMAAGLANAMGCIGFAFLLTAIVGLMLVVSSKAADAITREEKILHVTIPENLDYTDVFDEIFGKYTKAVKLERVKTTNMGSLFDLTYRIRERADANEKEMIDQIRTRNGNLPVICTRKLDTEAL